MSDAIELPPALSRALRLTKKHHADIGDVVEDVFRRDFAARLQNKSDLPSWHLSRLTGDGFPVEITFTTRRDAVRFTLEAYPRELPPKERAAQAFAIAGADVDATTAQVLALQQAGALQYGAWLGLRVRRSDVVGQAGHVEHKVYLEVPPLADDIVRAFAQPLLPHPLPVRGLALKMVGVVPGSGVVELYWSAPNLKPWELGALLAPVGLQVRTREVLAVVESAVGRQLHQALPGSIGCSHAVSSAGNTVTVYGMCDALFGSSSVTRRRMMLLFESLGVDMSFYEDLSAPLVDQQDKKKHGLFGVTVAAEGSPVVSIGLRPPEGS